MLLYMCIILLLTSIRPLSLSPFLQDAKGFASDLLNFIGTNAQVHSDITYMYILQWIEKLISSLLSSPSLPPSLQYLHSLIQMSSDLDTSDQGQHAKRLQHVEMSLRVGHVI